MADLVHEVRALLGPDPTIELCLDGMVWADDCADPLAALVILHGAGLTVMLERATGSLAIYPRAPKVPKGQ